LIGPFSEGELLIILAILILILGPSAVTNLARAIGESVREFKQAVREEGENRD